MFDPMNDSVIVWDLETVPDLGGFALANDLVGKTDEEVRAILGNKFPKHIHHSIVRICFGNWSTRERCDPLAHKEAVVATGAGVNRPGALAAPGGWAASRHKNNAPSR